MLRIDARIAVVESGDKAERDDVIFRSVNPRAAVLAKGERIAHGVDDLAGSDAARRNFPELLYADPIGLRVAFAIELEASDKLLGQRAARAFGQNHDLRLQVVAGLEIRFLLTAFVDTFVVGAHAGDASGVEEQFGAGEPNEN